VGAGKLSAHVPVPDIRVWRSLGTEATLFRLAYPPGDSLVTFP
jgi:hypothetical protein